MLVYIRKDKCKKNKYHQIIDAYNYIVLLEIIVIQTEYACVLIPFRSTNRVPYNHMKPISSIKVSLEAVNCC